MSATEFQVRWVISPDLQQHEPEVEVVTYSLQPPIGKSSFITPFYNTDHDQGRCVTVVNVSLTSLVIPINVTLIGVFGWLSKSDVQFRVSKDD